MYILSEDGKTLINLNAIDSIFIKSESVTSLSKIVYNNGTHLTPITNNLSIDKAKSILHRMAKIMTTTNQDKLCIDMNKLINEMHKDN